MLTFTIKIFFQPALKSPSLKIILKNIELIIFELPVPDIFVNINYISFILLKN